MAAPIASGGMGVVYRARDTKLDRDVALKVLPEPLTSSATALSRFEAEAKSVAALSHPGIVSIHDFGRIDGITFAITELLDGESLRSVLNRGTLPLGRALDVAAQVADALAAAHEQGLVHRDLKPENVYLLRDGRAKVLDFGIAVRCDPSAPDPGASETLTDPAFTGAPGTPGTAAYMSPEHARGLSVGAASDQFSLGVVLYEMLAGRRPFVGPSPAEVLSSVLRDEPPPLASRVPALPDPVRWIVDRCLRKRPEERYASTRDLARDLADARDRLREGSLAAPRAAPSSGAVRLLAAAFGALVVLLGLFASRWLVPGLDAMEHRRVLSSRRVQRLTERGANARCPTLSPDGRLVAFVRRLSATDTGVFVQSTDGTRPIDLTADHPGEDSEPAFSPDGTLLAFRSELAGGGLFTVESLGGPATRVTTFGHDPAWYPDGRRLVFATASSAAPATRLGTRSELWTVDVGTGATQPLFEGDAMQPAVSPRGFRVAFWALREGGARRDLATIPAEPGASPPDPVWVTSDEALDCNPFWTNDGWLWFASNRGGTPNLWRVRLDERSGRPLAEPEPVPVPARSAGPFRATPDGRVVAYQAGTSGFDLERLPLDERGEPAGEPVSLLADFEGMGEPRLSPSGDLVAFASRLAGEDLWVVGADGSGLRRVTTGPFRDRSPSFSADGRALFFHSDRSGKFEIWRVLLDGSALGQLTRLERLQPFRALASPDGRRIAVEQTGAGAALLEIDGPGEAKRSEVLPPPEKGLRFGVSAFSRDGRLAFGHAIGPDEEYHGIFVRDLAAGTYRKLSATGSCPQPVEGTPLVYFLRQRQLLQPSGLSVLDLETLASRDLPARRHEPSVVAFAAAPDGRALYVVRERSRSDVWLMRLP